MVVTSIQGLMKLIRWNDVTLVVRVMSNQLVEYSMIGGRMWTTWVEENPGERIEGW